MLRLIDICDFICNSLGIERVDQEGILFPHVHLGERNPDPVEGRVGRDMRREYMVSTGRDTNIRQPRRRLPMSNSINNLQAGFNESAFANIQTDLANGASADQLEKDGDIFLALSQGDNSAKKNAVNNMVKSEDDGSFSTEGTEEALTAAALADGLPEGSTPAPSSPTTPANSAQLLQMIQLR